MARLKGKITKEVYEKLEDSVKAFYEPDEDNKEKFVLKDGESEDVSGLKNALAEEKEKARRRQEMIEKFKDVDPEKYRDMMAKEKELEGIRTKIEAELKNTNAQWEDKVTKLTQKHTSREAGLLKSIEAMLIDNALLMAAGDKVLRPKMFVGAARQFVRVKEDKGDGGLPKFTVQVVDDKGSPRMSPKATDGSGMTLEELVEDLGNNDDFKFFYKASGASGTGSQQRPPAGPGTGGVKISREDAKDPQKYREARASAEKAGQGLPEIVD